MEKNNLTNMGFWKGCLLLIIPVFLITCKNEPKAKTPEKNLLQKIANANGFENWDNLEELRYTFNVDRDTSHFERSWIWRPKENKITFMDNSDTVSYIRSGDLNEKEIKMDRAFINDKYWLLFPFNLVWDKSFSHEINPKTFSPIDSISMTEVVISYNKQKGYTPGDIYKIYVDEDFMIREWSYFPSGETEPVMSTTWENYIETKGIKIAKTHRDKSGNFQIYFTDIAVK